MSHYRIYRFGHLVREIDGEETNLLEWIRDNVPAQNRQGIRKGDVMFWKRLLYEDARLAGITINKTKNETERK